jgi:hypothetical protein
MSIYVLVKKAAWTANCKHRFCIADLEKPKTSFAEEDDGHQMTKAAAKKVDKKSLIKGI